MSEIVILLLQKGADVNLAEQEHNFTPMDYLLLTDIGEYPSARHYLETFFTLLVFGANLSEENMEKINNAHYFYLKECFTTFEAIKEMPHFGKIIQGYRERNFEVALDYSKENNVEQLTQELQNIKRSYSSSTWVPFIPEILLDIVKYMMTLCMKTLFKIGALSGLICEAIHNELKKEVSLEDIVSPNVASMLSDQDAVNLSLVCKSVNCKANDRTKNMLLTQLEKVVTFADANAEVSGPQVGG